MAAKQHAGTYAVSGLDLDFAPFDEGDFDALAKAVAPTKIKVSRARFAELVPEMNKAARRWKVYCDVDPAPTDKQERAHVENIGKAAEKLASLLSAKLDADDPERGGAPRKMRGMAPVEVPYAQDWVNGARERGGVLPDGFPEDPTAEGAWPVPLVLDRLLEHFFRHYEGGGLEHRHFRIPEEALQELATMVRALSAGAADRLAEFAVAEVDERDIEGAKPFDGKLRGDMKITLDDAKSPNHALFLDLIPIYRKVVDPTLRRSRTSPNDSGRGQPGNQPSGPAVKFFTLVFDRLGAPMKGRMPATILDWIEDWKAQQEPEP